MPYAAHLDIGRQITEIGAWRELGESWAVAVIPDIEIGRILDLHAQRYRCTPQFESVTATHGGHRCCAILCDVINACGRGTKVLNGDISGERRPPRELVIGIDRPLDVRLAESRRANALGGEIGSNDSDLPQ